MIASDWHEIMTPHCIVPATANSWTREAASRYKDKKGQIADSQQAVSQLCDWCEWCLACRMGSHSVTCHSIQANPSLLYICEESQSRQTSTYCCRNLPGSEAGTNLYCLVNRGTCVNNLPKVVTLQCPDSELNLKPQGYNFGTLPLHY